MAPLVRKSIVRVFNTHKIEEKAEEDDGYKLLSSCLLFAFPLILGSDMPAQSDRLTTGVSDLEQSGSD